MSLFDLNLVGVKSVVTSPWSDLSRSYLFSINIPSLNNGNEGQSGGDFDFNTKKLSVFARSTQLPSYILKVKPIEFQTLQIQVVEGVQFSHTWTAEFLSDDTNILRGKFLRWSNLAYDFNRKAAASPSSYKRKAIVNQLDRNGNIICEYTMYGVFPRKVDSGNLDNDSVNFTKLSVEFRYDYYTVKIFPYGTPSATTEQPNDLGKSDLRSALPRQNTTGSFNTVVGV